MNSLDHPILFLEKLASGLGLDLSPDFYIDLQK